MVCPRCMNSDLTVMKTNHPGSVTDRYLVCSTTTKKRLISEKDGKFIEESDNYGCGLVMYSVEQVYAVQVYDPALLKTVKVGLKEYKEHFLPHELKPLYPQQLSMNYEKVKKIHKLPKAG